mgnify:CR=1 FL=1
MIQRSALAGAPVCLGVQATRAVFVGVESTLAVLVGVQATRAGAPPPPLNFPKEIQRLPRDIFGKKMMDLAFHCFQFVDESLDHAEALVPEFGVGGVKAEGGQESFVVFGAACFEHL